MAITTAAKRNAALLDPSGILIPDGSLTNVADRAAMLGAYTSIPVITPGDGIVSIPNWGVPYNPPQYSPQRWKIPRYKKPF